MGSLYPELTLDSKMLNAWQEVQKNLQDPMLGIQMMRRLAQENLAAYKTRHPLAGHLMPYMLEDEAHQQGLHFSEEHGWLEEDEKVVLSKRKQQ